MAPLIIYILGYIAAYACCKILRNETNDNDWNDVLISVLLSLISWLFVFGFLGYKLFTSEKVNSLFTNTRPPKWL